MATKPQSAVTPRLKICGVTTLADTRACREHAVSYVGFNLYGGSKRFIAPPLAAELWRAACASIPAAQVPTEAVLVFVDPELDEVGAALAAFPEAAAIQLHTAKKLDMAKLRAAVGKRALWRALAVAAAEDIALVETEGWDLVIFDSAKIAPGHAVPGGSGHTFDWTWLTSYRAKTPWGLAGGLGPGLIEPALRQQPALVDLCSRIEAAPGRKDLVLLAAVVEEFRAALARPTRP